MADDIDFLSGSCKQDVTDLICLSAHLNLNRSLGAGEPEGDFHTQSDLPLAHSQCKLVFAASVGSPLCSERALFHWYRHESAVCRFEFVRAAIKEVKNGTYFRTGNMIKWTGKRRERGCRVQVRLSGSDGGTLGQVTVCERGRGGRKWSTGRMDGLDWERRSWCWWRARVWQWIQRAALLFKSLIASPCLSLHLFCQLSIFLSLSSTLFLFSIFLLNLRYFFHDVLWSVSWLSDTWEAGIPLYVSNGAVECFMPPPLQHGPTAAHEIRDDICFFSRTYKINEGLGWNTTKSGFWKPEVWGNKSKTSQTPVSLFKVLYLAAASNHNDAALCQSHERFVSMNQILIFTVSEGNAH